MSINSHLFYPTRERNILVKGLYIDRRLCLLIKSFNCWSKLFMIALIFAVFKLPVDSVSFQFEMIYSLLFLIDWLQVKTRS